MMCIYTHKMFERITRKDIVAVNQRFDTGRVVNEGSLSYALDGANSSRSWLRGCVLLVRAVLLDHVFEEGNKRTAAAIIVSFFEEQGLPYDPERVARGVVRILMRKTTSLKAIEEVVLDAAIR